MPASPLVNIYLSPHLDDVVFSCGGQLYHQTQAGSRVVVVTICTGNPPGGPLSPYAQSLHERWAADAGTANPRAPAEIAAWRRGEDLAALAELGAEAVHLDVPDCIYRVNPGTNWPIYTSEAALFGSLHPSEQALVRRVAAKLATLLRGFGRHHLYVPLGIGQHVDHQLARRAAEASGGIFAYYEDFPYAAREGEHWPDPRSPLLEGRPLTPELARQAEADLAAWASAAARYASQISSFWPDRQGLASALQGFAERTGDGTPSIRLWRVG